MTAIKQVHVKPQLPHIHVQIKPRVSNSKSDWVLDVLKSGLFRETVVDVMSSYAGASTALLGTKAIAAISLAVGMGIAKGISVSSKISPSENFEGPFCIIATSSLWLISFQSIACQLSRYGAVGVVTVAGGGYCLGKGLSIYANQIEKITENETVTPEDVEIARIKEAVLVGAVGTFVSGGLTIASGGAFSFPACTAGIAAAKVTRAAVRSAQSRGWF